MEESAVA